MPFLRDLLDRTYSRARKLESGFDPLVPTASILNEVLVRALQLIRGLLRRYPGVYIAHGVRIKGRAQLTVEKSSVLGARVSIVALSTEGVRLADSVTVATGAVLSATSVLREVGVGIRVGARTSIGEGNRILGQGGIDIGTDCLFGPAVTVLSENHNFDDRRSPMRTLGNTRQRTFIGDDVWLGAGVIVLAGSRIGRGSVIAAGAVVRGDIPEFSVAGGVPARVLRMRGNAS